MQTLCQLSHACHDVIYSNHQSSSDIFSILDELILHIEGKQLYTRKAQDDEKAVATAGARTISEQQGTRKTQQVEDPAKQSA